MKVSAPVTLCLTADEILRALREAGYILPEDESVKLALLGTDGYYRNVNTKDKSIINISWSIEVEVGGPSKCKKDSAR